VFKLQPGVHAIPAGTSGSILIHALKGLQTIFALNTLPPVVAVIVQNFKCDRPYLKRVASEFILAFAS
jgi:hypothetical protein